AATALTLTQLPPFAAARNTDASPLFSLVCERGRRRLGFRGEMSAYDEVEIEDMEWNAELKAYTYPCPCGDLFQITLEDLRLGEEIARCPSCSLFLTVVYNAEDFADAKEPAHKPGPSPVAVA
uniref:Diphthamide biosynthesis protein 3 n=3 Tax=Setaria TaxID=4554 RepID=K3Y1J5_SETIT